MAETSDGTISYSAKQGIFEISTNKDDEETAMLLGQVEYKKAQQVKFYKWYVTTSDCRAGFGKVVALNLDGDPAFQVDFVADGGNVASGIADFICGVYTRFRAIPEKGN